MATKRTRKKKTVRKTRVRKPRDFKAEYARRIKNAIAKGKTRQQARGHKPQEHIIRREREKAETGGLTRDQVKTIRRWHSDAFNPKLYREVPTEDELVAWAQENGYERFKQYRKVWDAARRTYVKELADGSWESRGMGYLYQLTNNAKVDDYQWLYYH